MSDPTPPTDAAANQPKKGLSPWAWVAIGCGAIVLLGFVAFLALGAFVFTKGKDMVQEAAGADSIEEFVERLEDDPARVAAEMAIRLNPDLEIVSTDSDAGVITFRNVETGEETTLDFEDIAEGRFEVRTEEADYSFEAEGEEGGVTFSGPEGETRYGSSASVEDVPTWVHIYPDAESAQSAYHSIQGDEVTGAITLTTEDSPDTVMEHYRTWFEDAEYDVQSESKTTSGDITYAGIVGQLAARGRTINVGIVEQDGEIRVTINYYGKSE